MKTTRTPPLISDSIAEFCSSVAPGSKAEFVPVRAGQNAEVDDCFSVVEQRVKNNGGQMVIGWQIWETPGVILEAEFHAVWRRPRGQLLDLTPKRVRAPQILFLPDPGRTYDGAQVRPVLRPLTDLPELHSWIAAFDAYFEFLNRGERANQHGQIIIPPSEQDEAIQIQQRMIETRQAFERAIE